jgi:hypothetical protein
MDAAATPGAAEEEADAVAEADDKRDIDAG